MNRLPTQIRVREYPAGEWRIERDHAETPTVVTHIELTRERALQLGKLAADYHGVPLLVNGQEHAFQRSTDPKLFGGITRESLPY